MNYFNNISYMISHLFLMLFIYLFVTHRYSKTITKGICFTSFLLLGITDCIKLNLFPDSNLCYFIITLLQIFITQFTGIFISKKRNTKVLFIGLSASNYTIMGSVTAAILYIYTKNIPFALLGNFIVHTVLLFILYHSIRNIWVKQYENEYTKDWWKLCFIPVFFYCSFSFIAFFPYTLYDNPNNIPGIIFFMLTMIVSYVVVLQYIENDSKQKDMYWKNALFESYIKGLENQYYLVEQSEKNIKILRHDIRHYSSMINQLLNEQKYEEIRNILTHIDAVADEHKVIRYCYHLIANTILSKMMEKSSSFDIDVHLDVNIPKTVTVNDYEFSSVIANLFENAIICVKNFEKEERYIDIIIHCTKEQLFIQMKNRYKEEITFDSLTGLPKSKKNGNHGLGMQSALTFCQKIGGTIDCFCQDGFFYIILFAKF